MSMRALYQVALSSALGKGEDKQRDEELTKANENFLNQNFTILAQYIAEMENRISTLED